MTINKDSKNVRQRGNNSHGWGAKKKHRGAGHRGGRGAAGSGKRGDAKKPKIWKNKRYFGKYGFTSHSRAVEFVMINVHELEKKKDAYVASGKMSLEGDVYKVNLKDLGYNKLLGTGKVSSKISVEVYTASEKAIVKIKAAGGTVTVTSAEESSVSEE